jgi:hypothetical protein
MLLLTSHTSLFSDLFGEDYVPRKLVRRRSVLSPGFEGQREVSGMPVKNFSIFWFSSENE